MSQLNGGQGFWALDQAIVIVVHIIVSVHWCQGLEGPWRTMVLRAGSRVAEHMSIRPSAYETSHDVMPVDK